MIGFENPAAFFLLLIIPLVCLLRFIKVFSRISFPLTLGDWNGDVFQWKQKRRSFCTLLIRIFILGFYICLVTALANPVVHEQKKIYTSKGTSIVFVVDVSPSMSAKDIGELTRLSAAKKAIGSIAENFVGEEMGLVEMAQTAALVVPPTMDRKVFFDRLQSLKSGELGDGTAIGSGLSTAVYHLSKSTSPRKVIILITDGENNSGIIHPNTAARLCAKKNVNLYILGLGTHGTVPLEYLDPVTGKMYSGYLESNYNSSLLCDIAAEGDGKYYEVDSLPMLVQSLSAITNNESTIQSYYIKNNDTFYYYYFLVAASVLIIFAWFFSRILMREVL